MADRQRNEELWRSDKDYRYPNGMDLRPTSELHGRIIRNLLRMANDSYRSISCRFNTWKEIDKKLTAYIPLSSAETKEKSKFSNRPIGVVMPETYAALDTHRAFLMASLMGPPFIPVEAVGPEDVLGAAMMEAHIAWQVRKLRTMQEVAVQVMDSLSYGIGVTTINWCQKWGLRNRAVQAYDREPSEMDDLAGEYPQLITKYEQEDYVKVEGNEVTAIDPYLVLPDPNTPIHKFYQGEYFGYGLRTTRQNVLRSELYDSSLFNARYLEAIDATSPLVYSRALERDGATLYPAEYEQSNVADEICLFVDLVPSDPMWQLGDSDRPEKWQFWMVGDQLLIKAEKLPFNHQEFPCNVTAPDFNGHTLTPISRLEMTYGMQTWLDFMLNSRVENVRKSIYGQYVANLSMIDVDALMNPKHGGIIPLSDDAIAMGFKPDDVLSLLKIPDVTSNHMSDAMIAADQIRRGTGATDAMQGNRRQKGEAMTATEANVIRQGTYGRAGWLVDILTQMMIVPMGEIFVSNTQQYASEARWMEITGRHAQALQMQYGPGQKILVNPQDLNVNLDVLIGDSMNIRDINVQDFMMMLDRIAANPMVYQMDLPRLGMAAFRALGMKNPEDYRLQTMVMPDEQVAQQVQAGNLVTMQQAGEMNRGTA